jgi:hypothetical protein
LPCHLFLHRHFPRTYHSTGSIDQDDEEDEFEEESGSNSFSQKHEKGDESDDDEMLKENLTEKNGDGTPQADISTLPGDGGIAPGILGANESTTYVPPFGALTYTV